MYEGQFKNGTFEGVGRLFDLTPGNYGQMWTGNFKNGKQDGFNTQTNPDGKAQTSFWTNGKVLMSKTQYELSQIMGEEPASVISKQWKRFSGSPETQFNLT